MAVLSNQRHRTGSSRLCADMSTPRNLSRRIGWGLGTRCLVIAMPCLMAALATGPACAQSNADEYRVKAAFLFNFGQFVEWPAERAAGADRLLNLCSTGDDRIRAALKETVTGKQLNGIPVAVKFIAKGESPLDCHILFLAMDDKKAVGAVLAELKNAPILTVGETADFTGQGGMIRFCLEENKVRFEINPAAAERAGLKISSRLLLLAKAVIGERKQG